eukprot:COSAG01_NODE_56127_length_320_cov_1.104072_1_plen_59_part_01
MRRRHWHTCDGVMASALWGALAPSRSLEQEIADLQMPPNAHFNETELVELVKDVLAAHD